MLTVNCKFWGRLGGLILFLLLGFRPADAAVFDWRDKVDPWVLETAVPQPTPDSSDSSEALPQTEFLVFLTAQADLSGAAQQPDRLAKGQYVYEQLTTLAGQTQTAVLNQLDDLGAVYEPFWIANMIWVRSNIGVIEAMARRSDVAHLYANPQVALDVIPPPPIETDFSQTAVAGVEWNVDHINAPDLWAAGHTGQGVVIGGQDTGYEWEHPALINAYRGWDGGSADHNYNWHDAIHSTAGTNICGSDSPEPCDDFSSSHGTHTMGIMTGNDLAPDDPGWPAAATNAVGVAPGAQWIGCRNMDNGSGTPASYSECYQWFLAPTDLDGNNPNPALAPHVINNSWSCPPSEGCTPDALLTVVDSVRAAGIVTVHAAGNSGPSCSSIDTPAAIYDSSLTVGNTGSSDTINSTSSRGPVTVDGSGRLKPDVVAPGTGIRSTVRNDGYGILTGTSMAAPHVAGLVALLISADPDLAGDVDAIETLIGQTAVPLTTTQGCGDTATAVPNNVYGYGRVDAFPIFIDLLEEELYIPLLLKP